MSRYGYYAPLRTAGDWIKRKVKSRREIVNGMGKMPAGTVFTVYGARDGLKLQTERCAACGGMFTVTGINPADVQLIDGFYADVGSE